MQADPSPRQAALARLEPLIGEWTVGAVRPDGAALDLSGRCVFERILDGRYVSQRATIEHPVPDSLSIIAAADDGETFTQHYFDTRGVVRLYEMTFADGAWTLRRDAADFSPLPFRQRFEGAVAADGDTIRGRWEICRDGERWETDFELVYRRV